MGSDFSKQICCVICERCKKREAEEANKDISETKPILQTSGETLMYTDTPPSTPALEVSKQGSEEVQSLCQDRQPSADAAVENMETCSAADPVGMTEGWEAAWGSPDFLVAPADGKTKREVKVLTQLDRERQKVGNAEEKIKPVPHASVAQLVTPTAQDAKLVADKEQPDKHAEASSEDSPCAGITVQERNIFSFIEITSETAPGQDCEIKTPAETGDTLIGKILPLCAAQTAEETETYPSAEHVEEMDEAKLAEISPRSTERAELTCLAKTASLLMVQAMQKAIEAVDPLEAIENGMAEMYSTSAVPRESLYPKGESLEPANLTCQLLDFSQQETQSRMPTAQEMESLHCAELVEPSEVLCQSSNEGKVLGELQDEESRECDVETAANEAEPQHRIMQQTIELPEEPLTCVPIPVKEEAEFLNVAPSLSEVLGSSGETEAGSVEA